MATTCEHPGNVSCWYLVMPGVKTVNAGGAPTWEQAIFSAVRHPGWEVVGGFIWNLKESLRLKTEIWEASAFKEEWKPWVVNGVPQRLCKEVERQVSGPQICSDFEWPFATRSSVSSLNWLYCFEINTNIPFRVFTSEVWSHCLLSEITVGCLLSPIWGGGLLSVWNYNL